MMHHGGVYKCGRVFGRLVPEGDKCGHGFGRLVPEGDEVGSCVCAKRKAPNASSRWGRGCAVLATGWRGRVGVGEGGGRGRRVPWIEGCLGCVGGCGAGLVRMLGTAQGQL